MNRQRWGMLVLVLVLLGAAGTWAFPRLFRQVSVEEPLPATGEAAYNPLYALRLGLQARGAKVSTWPHLAGAERSLRRRDTLLLFHRPEAMTHAQAERLLAWVRAGGHLVIPGPPSGVSPGPLAEALGLRAQSLDPKGGKTRAKVDSDAGHVPAEAEAEERFCERLLTPYELKDKQATGRLLCQPRFVANVPGFQFGGGNRSRGYRFARRTLEEGVVTVAELHYLDNMGLRAPAARALAYQLLAPGLHRGRLHLVYSAEVPSLFRLLLQYAWMVLIPLVLALAAWLSWRGQSLGVPQPVPAPRRRALLEHVQAAGEFAYRRQRGSALHAAVLRLFQQRLQRRQPTLAVLDGDALVQALALATDLPAARVRQALVPSGLHHRATFIQTIATLLQMRNRL